MASLVTVTWKVLLDRNCYSLLLTTVCSLSLVCSLVQTAKNKFTSTTLLSFEQLIQLGYFTLVFGGEVTSLLASRFLGGELVGGEMTRYHEGSCDLMTL